MGVNNARGFIERHFSIRFSLFCYVKVRVGVRFLTSKFYGGRGAKGLSSTTYATDANAARNGRCRGHSKCHEPLIGVHDNVANNNSGEAGLRGYLLGYFPRVIGRVPSIRDSRRNENSSRGRMTTSLFEFRYLEGLPNRGGGVSVRICTGRSRGSDSSSLGVWTMASRAIKFSSRPANSNDSGYYARAIMGERPPGGRRSSRYGDRYGMSLMRSLND